MTLINENGQFTSNKDAQRVKDGSRLKQGGRSKGM